MAEHAPDCPNCDCAHLKKYLVVYDYDDIEFTFRIVARDKDEAFARIEAIKRGVAIYEIFSEHTDGSILLMDLSESLIEGTRN